MSSFAIDVPTDASISIHREWLLIELRTDWDRRSGTYPAGSLLAANYDEFLSGTADLRRRLRARRRTPASTHYAWTRDQLVLVTLADVASRVADRHARYVGSREPVAGHSGQHEHGDRRRRRATATRSSWTPAASTRPSRLLWGHVGGELTEIKSAPAFFDAADIEVAQHFVASDDGTMIPYFVVGHRDVDGPGPTLLGGYGGFEVVQHARLRRRARPAVAGARRHLRAGQHPRRRRVRADAGTPRRCARAGTWSHEDFAAVAADLVTRGITTVEQLGAQGGSNGGLLMGIMLTKYPELFGALVCSVPLLDMKRFHLLLAGRVVGGRVRRSRRSRRLGVHLANTRRIRTSRPTAAIPPLLMTTSTRDDRVHPGHARKMTAALEAAGHPVQYYENIEGGHAGAADNAQTAFRSALIYEFLHRTLTK